jgi:hypothetical protein
MSKSEAGLRQFRMSSARRAGGQAQSINTRLHTSVRSLLKQKKCLDGKNVSIIKPMNKHVGEAIFTAF